MLRSLASGQLKRSFMLADRLEMGLIEWMLLGLLGGALGGVLVVAVWVMDTK